jgi:SPP1 family predicted phage head-tail adaptor
MSEYPHEIVIQHESKVSDGAGGNVNGWVTFKTVKAHVQPISGNILLQAQQIQSNINHKVFMEYDDEITSKMRVLYNNKPLTISNIIDQGGLNEIMVLMCNGK